MQDFSLTIKGGPEDDAVLCTSDRTYNIRSVTLSNSILVVSSIPHIEDQVVIQDSLNELLELVPSVPKLHRMNVLLQEHVWEEGHEEDDRFRAVGTWPGPIPAMARLRGHFQGEAEAIHPRRRPDRTSGQRARDCASAPGEAYTQHRW